jgi:hypothetical protein
MFFLLELFIRLFKYNTKVLFFFETAKFLLFFVVVGIERGSYSTRLRLSF